MRPRLQWDDAPVFLAIARTGTLTAAARRLGAGVATVSRRIERLEAALGVPLFVRHQTGYRLTDEGEALLPRAEALERAMLGLSAEAAAASEAVGQVRLATAENLATAIVIPSLGPLLDQHPGLALEIVTDVATVNLHRRDADLALRMVRPSSGNVVVRRVGTLGYGLYGADRYLAARGRDPADPSVDDDQLIGWSERQASLPAAQWVERTLAGKPPVLVTTSLQGQIAAAAAGLGLAVLPHFLGRERGLQQLPLAFDVDQPIWLTVHADLAASRRVRVVADHLAQTIESNRARLSGEPAR